MPYGDVLDLPRPREALQALPVHRRAMPAQELPPPAIWLAEQQLRRHETFVSMVLAVAAVAMFLLGCLVGAVYMAPRPRPISWSPSAADYGSQLALRDDAGDRNGQ